MAYVHCPCRRKKPYQQTPMPATTRVAPSRQVKFYFLASSVRKSVFALWCGGCVDPIFEHVRVMQQPIEQRLVGRDVAEQSAPSIHGSI
jgi:hypothetical protein